MSSPREPLGIVVGIDGSAPSKVAVDWAAREAELRNLPLTIVYAVRSLVGKIARQRVRRIVDDAIRVQTRVLPPVAGCG